MVKDANQTSRTYHEVTFYSPLQVKLLQSFYHANDAFKRDHSELLRVLMAPPLTIKQSQSTASQNAPIGYLNQ